MIRVAVIGCGKIAQTRHIPEYEANADAQIMGFYDLNQERAKGLAARFGGKAYESVEALLADPNIDAVSVCVANNAHAKVSIDALRAGKHVLCEKPMAITLQECEDMVAAARKADRKLMIDQNQRFTKAHRKAKALLEADEIGKVLTFRTTFGHGGPETWSIDPGKSTWFFDKSKAAMGAMADLGVHKTDLIQWLTNSRVVETSAVVRTLDKRYSDGSLIGVDDNTICTYTMDNGAIGTMTASWTYYGEEDNSTVLYGTKGIMKIYSDPDYSIIVIHSDGSKAFYQIDQIQTNDNQTSTGVIDEFIDALENHREPAVRGEDVLSAMRVVFANIESAQKNIPVKVDQSV
jgi:predicted dehydrogenase